jgi:tetratricopeptide (TPR) repeat protein
LLIYGCGEHQDKSYLLTADSLTEAAPDSAVRYLDAISGTLENASKDEQMHYKLLCIKAADKADMDIAKDTIAFEIVKYYEHHSDNALLPMAYYYAGRVASCLNDAPRALGYFQKTTDAAGTDVKNLKIKSKAYSQIGNSFIFNNLYSEAIDAYEKSYKCDVENRDTIGLIYNLRDIAYTYKLNDDFKKAIPYLKKALNLAEVIGDSDMIADACIPLAGNYSELNEFGKAEKYLRQAFRINYTKDESALVATAAVLYSRSGKMDSALIYYAKMIKIGNIYARQKACCDLAEYYYKKGDLKQSIDYTHRYKLYTDTILTTSAAEAVAKMNSMYNYQLREKENNKLNNDNRNKNIIIGIIIFLSVVAIIASAIIIYRKRRRCSFLSAEINYMDGVMADIKMKSESSIAVNEVRINKLEEKIASLNDENCSLKSELEETKQAIVADNNTALKELQERKKHHLNIMQTDIYRYFKEESKKDKMDVHLSQEDWNGLEKLINKEYLNFSAKLFSLCKMSAHDYHVCMLLKIGMQIDEISTITVHSRQSVTSSRSRLYKRAFNRKGEATEWDEVIESL